MPARIAVPPSICTAPNASWNATAPVAAPTSGSRFTNAPASSGATRACPQANSANGSSVPGEREQQRRRRTGSGRGRRGGHAARARANGSETSAPAASCTAVTATGVAPGEQPRLGDDEGRRAGDRGSTSSVAGRRRAAPPPPATRPTPASASAKPSQAARPLAPRPSAAAISATSAGTAPTISARVADARVLDARVLEQDDARRSRARPAATTAAVSAARSAPARDAARAAARPRAKRATASQPAPSHSSASLESGTVRPHSDAGERRARGSRVRMCGGRRSHFDTIVGGSAGISTDSLTSRHIDEILFRANGHFHLIRLMCGCSTSCSWTPTGRTSSWRAWSGSRRRRRSTASGG